MRCIFGIHTVQICMEQELKVTRDDPGLLVVTSSVARQLEDLSGQILENSGQVHWSSGANTLSEVAFAEMTVDTTDRKLKPCTG